ncbi:MAG: ATP-binding protein [Chloroflexota bacterium]
MRAILTINATFEALIELESFIDALTPTVSRHLRGQILLAMHELCANIIEHAYAGAAGTIALEGNGDATSLQLSIYDHAPNAYIHTEIALPKPLDLPEGGWGLAILYAVFERVEYERLDSGNHWLLFKAW